MGISLGLEVQKHEFLPLPDPKPGSKGELTLAVARSIHPCTHLGNLGIPSRQKLLDDWFYEGVGLFLPLAESAKHSWP